LRLSPDTANVHVEPVLCAAQTAAAVKPRPNTNT
jgi:hypothetical protein